MKADMAAEADAPVVGEKPAAKSSNGPGVVKKTGGAWNVDPDTIAVRPGWNIRTDMGDLKELAEQIRAKLERDPESGGLMHPIGLLRLAPSDPLSEGGKYLFEVVRGHRRAGSIHLLRKAGVSFPFGVPATILDKGMDIRTATIEMFVENGGKPLLPYERALGFKRLRDGDPDLDMPPMTLKEIEKATGFSDNTINASLALLEGDEELVEAMRSGDVTPGDAMQIAVHARGDRQRQKQLVGKARAAKKGGKEERRAFRKEVKQAQREKHAKKGRVVKGGALSAGDLSLLGAEQSRRVVERLKDTSLAADADLAAWVSGDRELALAASFGALMALKVAAGMNEVSLEF
jgi:hypothetical protein